MPGGVYGITICIWGFRFRKVPLFISENYTGAGEHPALNYMVLVPEQFTMQTQKDLVLMNEKKGIMNIDVLSFGRLAYRIFEETGKGNTPVLDDEART